MKKSSIGNKEYRYSILTSNEEDMIVEGYAIVFETPATHGYTEIIDRNALNGVDLRDVCLKYNHGDGALILARTRNNSLELTVDEKGLFIRAKLIDTQNNRDIYKMVKSGLLDKMSFAFTVKREEWDVATDERRVLEIDKLFEVSIVDVPFYDEAEVYARSKEAYQKKEQKLELEKAKLKMMLEIIC